MKTYSIIEMDAGNKGCTKISATSWQEAVEIHAGGKVYDVELTAKMRLCKVGNKCYGVEW